MREEIGPTRTLMIDANQRWDVGEAIERVSALAKFDPLVDRGADQPGRRARARGDRARRSRRSASRPASTAPNRVMFKQLLQAEAIGFCQIDSCRLGGVNENLAVILMAAKFGVPVCPHAGGVGLCEHVQHLSMFDYIAVSGNDGGSRHGVRRSPARAFRGPGDDQTGALRRARTAWLQQRDKVGVTRAVSIPGRACLERVARRWARLNHDEDDVTMNTMKGVSEHPAHRLIVPIVNVAVRQ